MSQNDPDVFMSDRALAVLSSNWASYVADGGTAENGGTIIPSSTWNNFNFGPGDFAVFSELCVSPTGTPPTDPGATTPTGWTVATSTFTDGASRGCRYSHGYKILDGTEPNTRMRYCAIPAAGASSFRYTIVRCFYMNRPVQSVTFGGAVASTVNTDPALLTILLGAENSLSAYDCILGVARFHGVQGGGMTDLQTVISPVKGTEYFDYDNMTRAVSAGNDGINVNAKIKYNAYCRGDTTANMTLDMADTGSTNVAHGSWYKLR